MGKNLATICFPATAALDLAQTGIYYRVGSNYEKQSNPTSTIHYTLAATNLGLAVTFTGLAYSSRKRVQ
jgi:hypothetical protein